MLISTCVTRGTSGWIKARLAFHEERMQTGGRTSTTTCLYELMLHLDGSIIVLCQNFMHFTPLSGQKWTWMFMPIFIFSMIPNMLYRYLFPFMVCYGQTYVGLTL